MLFKSYVLDMADMIIKINVMEHAKVMRKERYVLKIVLIHTMKNQSYLDNVLRNVMLLIIVQAHSSIAQIEEVTIFMTLANRHV